MIGSDEEFLSLPLLWSILEAERRQGIGRVDRRASSSGPTNTRRITWRPATTSRCSKSAPSRLRPRAGQSLALPSRLPRGAPAATAPRSAS